MPDKNNEDHEQDKPSFFDFASGDDNTSEEESREWPPAGGFEDSDDDESDFSDLDSGETASGAFPWESDDDGSEESVEEILQDQSDEVQEDHIQDDVKEAEQVSDLEEESFLKPVESNHGTEEVSFLTPVEKPEELPEPEEAPASMVDDSSDADVDILFGGNIEEASSDPSESIEESKEDIDHDPLFGGDISTEAETSSNFENLFFNDDSDAVDSVDTHSDDYFDSIISSAANEDEDNTDEEDGFKPADKPFKAFASYDYSDEVIEEFDEDEEEKKGLQLSRPALIFIILLLLVGGYFIYNNFFNRTYESSGPRRRAREPRTKKIFEAEKQLLPLWDVTAQKGGSWKQDQELIRTSLAEAGRENPFALPQSVLDDIKKDIEAKIERDQKPDVFKKTAYRATLTGILTSRNDTIALVQLKTAVFDVTDGTEKPKIIKSAIKAMNKAEDDSLEVFTDDYLGPWKIIEIDDGRGDGSSEPLMRLEREGDIKELRMGKPVELGIFDEEGQLDTFKENINEEDEEEE